MVDNFAIRASKISQLSNVITTNEFEPVTAVDVYRSYGSTLNTVTKINNMTQTTNNSIIYRIGKRDESVALALRRNINLHPYGQRFRYNPTLCSEITGLNRRFTNFSELFAFGDLSAMLFRLGQCIGLYALTGELTFNEVMAGNQLSIRGLGVADDPVNSSDSMVFIPRHSSVIDNQATFCALVAAANSTGATVATDVIAVDGNNNAPMFTRYNGSMLMDGCINAVRVIFQMYDVSNAGAIAVYAFVKGLHDVGTVVGHTDEGAYTRDVLRQGNFAVPYGGIFCKDIGVFTGMASPQHGNKKSYQAYYDSMLLISAAAVANSDPCTIINGNVHSSIFASSLSRETHGVAIEGTEADSIEIRRLIAQNCSNFCENYINELCSIFGTEGCNDIAAAHLTYSFSINSDLPNRHLKMPVAAPFYWIEPTSLFQHRSDTVAGRAGLGAIVGTYDDSYEMPLFKNMTIKKTSNDVSFVACRFPSARSSGLILHHALSQNDGLANVKIRQAQYEAFALRGGLNENIGESIEQRRTLDKYLWQRGDGGIPAPAELTYTGEAIMFEIKHFSRDINDTPIMNSMKTCYELDTTYKLKCTRPSFFGVRPNGFRPREVIKARTMAATALSSIHNWHRCFTFTGGEDFLIGNTSPTLEKFETTETKEVALDKVNLEEKSEGYTARGVPASMVTHDTALRPRAGNVSTSNQSALVTNTRMERNIDNNIINNNNIEPGDGLTQVDTSPVAQ